MKRIALLLGLASVVLASCEKATEVTPLVIPTAYDATTFATNTAPEYQLRTNFTNLINEVKRGRVAGTQLSAAKLTELANTGSASVMSFAPSAFKNNLTTWFTEIEKASKGTTYQFGKTPAENGNGGVNGGYLFDETGLELEQMIDKASYNAIFYAKAADLLTNSPSLANLDKAVALFGAHPSFPNTPTAGKTAQPDIWMANYGARRTKASGGLYTEARDAFIKAQAAIKAGNNYTTQRTEAINTILLKWEEMNAATVINYLFATETGLSTTNADDKTKAAAMHAYGECIGFLSGFQGIAKKKITDAQIASLLTLMNQAAPYKLVGSPAEIAKLVQARKELQAIYGFSATQMEEFKNNWISVEGR